LFLPALLLGGCAGAVETRPVADVKAFFAAAQEANLQGMTCLTPQNYVDLSAYAPFMGVKYPPTDSVEILSGPPSRPYQAFAVLQCPAASPAPGTPAAEVLAQFTAKAKDIGADALIICPSQDDSPRDNADGPQKVEAVAIKYRLENPKEKKGTLAPDPG